MNNKIDNLESIESNAKQKENLDNIIWIVKNSYEILHIGYSCSFLSKHEDFSKKCQDFEIVDKQKFSFTRKIAQEFFYNLIKTLNPNAD